MEKEQYWYNNGFYTKDEIKQSQMFQAYILMFLMALWCFKGLIEKIINI